MMNNSRTHHFLIMKTHQISFSQTQRGSDANASTFDHRQIRNFMGLLWDFKHGTRSRIFFLEGLTSMGLFYLDNVYIYIYIICII